MLERTTQPMTDAVIERPQTLVEKLKQEVNRLLELKAQEKPHSLGYVFLGHHIAATINATNIVRQHSDWVSADEEIPVLEVECGFRSFESTNFYQIIDNEGCLHNAYFSTNHYANDDRALFTLCELSLYNGKWLVDDEYEVITVNMVKFWKPLQLPNQAQEKIYEQEMDKINFCGCGCILPDYLTRCSDCEALDD